MKILSRARQCISARFDFYQQTTDTAAEMSGRVLVDMCKGQPNASSKRLMPAPVLWIVLLSRKIPSHFIVSTVLANSEAVEECDVSARTVAQSLEALLYSATGGAQLEHNSKMNWNGGHVSMAFSVVQVVCHQPVD